MKDKDIHEVMMILREEYKKWKLPAVTRVAKRKDPFKVLVSTLISLRTKDEVTDVASKKLFRIADTPYSMVKVPARDIEKAIYPAGFYRTKAKNIKRVCSIILDKYQGRVPDSIDELLAFPGVGRKTANLVVTLGYGKPGICVDTHVHRVSNRLGYVSTKTPDKTEFALRDKLPTEYWIEYNDLLVTYGKYVCTPVSPFCSKCKLYGLCARIGIIKSR
jgi:endonuclease-3